MLLKLIRITHAGDPPLRACLCVAGYMGGSSMEAQVPTLTTGGKKLAKSDRDKSTTIFLASSIKSIVVLILLFLWNQSEISQTWELSAQHGYIKCRKRISSVCMTELFSIGGETGNFSSSSPSSSFSSNQCFSHHDLCSRKSYQCPKNLDFVPDMKEYNDAVASKKRRWSKIHGSWGMLCVSRWC